MIEVTVKQKVTEEQILNSLITWHDSGLSNFWIDHVNRRPYRTTKQGDEEVDSLQLPITIKVQDDCEIDGHRRFTLGRKAIERGVKAMAQRYPKQFAQEFPANPDDYNGDAATADLFVQCCLFGKEEFA